MKSIIRWKYVAPRLGLVALVSLAVWLGTDWVVQWMLVSSGQAMTGAKIDVGELDASLFGGTFGISGLQVANPDNTDENLVQFDNATLIVDRSELLKRRLVVKDGRITGLRFNTARTTSGALEKKPVTPKENKTTDDTSSNLEWLTKLATVLDTDRLEREFQSYAMSKDLLSHWPKQYDRLSQQAKDIKRRVETFREFFDNPRLNPITDAPRIQQGLEDAKSLKDEIAKLRSDIGRLQNRIAEDSERLLSAKDGDLKNIKKLANLENIDREKLADYLLGSGYGGTANSVIDWINWARPYLPKQRSTIKAERMRGETVLFAGVKQQPYLLFKSLAIDGQVELDGRALSLAGTARDLTPQPEVLGRPAVFNLQTTGAAEMQIDIVADRTTAESIDHVHVWCPSLHQSKQVLGKANQLAVAVEPGNMTARLVLDLHGQDVKGSLQLNRAAVQLSSQLPKSNLTGSLETRLNDSLAEVNSMDMVINFGGTLKQPKLRLQSDFGKEIAGRITHVVKSEVAAQRDQLTGKVNHYIDGQLDQLVQKLVPLEQAALETLSISETQIAQLTKQASDRLGLSLRGKSIPLPVGNVPERIGKLPSFGDIFPSSRD